jgi:hypothetical protein
MTRLNEWRHSVLYVVFLDFLLLFFLLSLVQRCKCAMQLPFLHSSRPTVQSINTINSPHLSDDP